MTAVSRLRLCDVPSRPRGAMRKANAEVVRRFALRYMQTTKDLDAAARPLPSGGSKRFDRGLCSCGSSAEGRGTVIMSSSLLRLRTAEAMESSP